MSEIVVLKRTFVSSDRKRFPSRCQNRYARCGRPPERREPKTTSATPRSIGSISAGTSAGSYSRSSAQTASRTAPIVADSLYAGTRKDTRMAAQPNLHAVRFDLEVTIARPVAAVFAYVTDVRNLPEWQDSAIEAEWIEPQRRFRERRSFLGRTAETELEVTAFEPERRFDVKAVKGP